MKNLLRLIKTSIINYLAFWDRSCLFLNIFVGLSLFTILIWERDPIKYFLWIYTISNFILYLTINIRSAVEHFLRVSRHRNEHYL